MKVQLCVLCGEREATKGKGDHIPPRGIYPKPRSANVEFHKVPACNECNNHAGVEDEEFKFSIGISTGEFRKEQAEVIGSMARTIGFNKRLARQMFSTSQRTYTNRGKGVLEPVVSVGFKYENYAKVIKRLVRGLFWRETDTIMAEDTDMVVFPAIDMAPCFAEKLQGFMDCIVPRKLNGDTFTYKVHFEDDGSSVWGMQFFATHTVFAYTKPNEHNIMLQPTRNGGRPG